jgi:hypothetical protein
MRKKVLGELLGGKVTAECKVVMEYEYWYVSSRIGIVCPGSDSQN